MTLLQLIQGSKHFGTKVLFDNAQFSVNEGEHVGVIGPNGAGKTTLFKLLLGRESLDQGQIIKMNGLRIAYLEQESDWTGLDQTPESYFQARPDHHWPLWEVKQWGLRLGLYNHHFQQTFRSFSGGYRMRFKLLDLISQNPQLMLLDEPTNFLDLETLFILESFLRDYSGAFLLISHDREFLKRVAEHTLEVESGEIQKFPGTIDDYFEMKEELKLQLEKQSLQQDAKRRHLESFIERFRAKATKAKQAQSRLKQLEKMEAIEIKSLPIRAHIPIPNPATSGKEVAQFIDVELGYDTQRPLLKSIRWQIQRGDHVGIVGINGAGKSTFLKALAGLLPPQKGQIHLGYEVRLSFFAQHSADQLQNEESVLDSLSKAAHPSVTHQDVLNMAGALLFSGQDVHKKIKILSGGEKSRVALGQVLLEKNPLLILDEPTNHLDFDTVEALTQALTTYSGAIVVVSHDRSFIRRIANKILEIRDGRVQSYPGSYDEYVWSLERGVLKDILDKQNDSIPSTGAPVSSPKLASLATDLKSQAPQTQTRSYEERKKYESDRRKLEKELKSLEIKLDELSFEQAKFNEQIAAANTTSLLELTQKLASISEQIVEAENRYYKILEELQML